MHQTQTGMRIDARLIYCMQYGQTCQFSLFVGPRIAPVSATNLNCRGQAALATEGAKRATATPAAVRHLQDNHPLVCEQENHWT